MPGIREVFHLYFLKDHLRNIKFDNLNYQYGSKLTDYFVAFNSDYKFNIYEQLSDHFHLPYIDIEPETSLLEKLSQN